MESRDQTRGRGRAWAFGRAGLPAAVIAAGLALAFPGEARAQRPFVVEARAGVVVSTPLVEGTVAFPARPSGDSVQTFEVAPAAGPMLTLAGRTVLDEGLELELAAGWSFTRVEGRQGGETWEVRDVGIGHAVLGLRQRVLERFHVRGGLGLIHYGADDGVFDGAGRIRPLAEAAAGAELDVSGLRVAVMGLGQAHSFGSTALRAGAGSGTRGQDGTVYRFALQVGVLFGPGAP